MPTIIFSSEFFDAKKVTTLQLPSLESSKNSNNDSNNLEPLETVEDKDNINSEEEDAQYKMF